MTHTNGAEGASRWRSQRCSRLVSSAARLRMQYAMRGTEIAYVVLPGLLVYYLVHLDRAPVTGHPAPRNQTPEHRFLWFLGNLIDLLRCLFVCPFFSLVWTRASQPWRAKQNSSSPRMTHACVNDARDAWLHEASVYMHESCVLILLKEEHTRVLQMHVSS